MVILSTRTINMNKSVFVYEQLFISENKYIQYKYYDVQPSDVPVLIRYIVDLLGSLKWMNNVDES